MQRLCGEAEAEYRAQILDNLRRSDGLRLLDVGCDDGSWTATIAQHLALSPQQVAGVEIAAASRERAAARGFDVRSADLEERWPFDDGSFDLIHANQVIEHVKRLDHFVSEIRRLLRPGAHAVVCTENLASWHNVGALLLGYMPFSAANISQKGPVGNPFALHAGEEVPVGESWQHVHVLTLEGLVSLFRLHGFVIERVFGAGYYPAFGRLASWLARRHPRHAHFIGVVARHGG